MLSNDNIISKEKEKYKLKISIIENQISFKIEMKNNNQEEYLSNFTIERLSEKSNLFSYYNNINSAFKVISKIISKESYKITFNDKSALINMTFNDDIESKNFELLIEKVIMPFNKKIENKINQLEQRIINLEKLLKIKDQEILLLKNNSQNKEQISRINQIIDELKVTIDNMNKKKYVEWIESTDYDGNTYIGQTVNGVRCGFGTLIGKLGDVYNGMFIQNKKEGYGMINFTENYRKFVAKKLSPQQLKFARQILSISGTFINNKQYGLATRYYLNGDIETFYNFEKSPGYFDILGENITIISAKNAKILINNF